MEHHVKLNWLSAAVVVALGVVVSVVTSTVVAARAYRARGDQTVHSRQTITVKGSTRQRIRSDRAVWQVQVKGDGATLKDAFEALSAGVERVSGFLTRMEFNDDDFDLRAIETDTHYVRDAQGRQTREVAGYTLRRAFVVQTDQVNRVELSAGRVTELIKEGVQVISRAPKYYFSKLARLKIDLMAAASADARARAKNIAQSTGCALGPLSDARVGVLQVTRPLSTEISGYGIYDTATIEKDVRAVVTATFGISRD